MSKGRFGIYGGQYIPELLMNAVIELEEAYNRLKNDPKFNEELANVKYYLYHHNTNLEGLAL
jgi:tryptophan synthase beta chain